MPQVITGCILNKMPLLDLKRRTFNFAVEVAKLVDSLPYNLTNRQYFAQLIRSSSSVGANYRASQRAKSGKDFLNKLKIVEEEIDESVYFLELLSALNEGHEDRIRVLINQGIEILKIIVASINTTKNRLRNTNSS